MGGVEMGKLSGSKHAESKHAESCLAQEFTHILRCYRKKKKKKKKAVLWVKNATELTGNSRFR
eukprot:COSAG05_NODE_540_length_8845_cov_13.872742_1_plen_62_part_10